MLPSGRRTRSTRTSWHFSTSFTYHPREMTAVIVREIKKRKKQGPVDVRALLWELERMSLQADRFKNVSIEAIYNFESDPGVPGPSGLGLLAPGATAMLTRRRGCR